MRFRLALLLLVAVPSAAFAHKMMLYVEVTPTELRVMVKYDGADHGGSGPAVKLLRMPGEELVEKKETDKKGEVVFAKPAKGKYRVIAEDEFHDAEKLIEVGEELTVYDDGPGNKLLLMAAGVTAIVVLTVVAWHFSKPKKA
jgi:hypothetical protein